MRPLRGKPEAPFTVGKTKVGKAETCQAFHKLRDKLQHGKIVSLMTEKEKANRGRG